MAGMETLTPKLSPLELLAGSWSVHRSLYDRLSGAEGSFVGTATFVPLQVASGRAATRLGYSERGTLHFGGYVGRACRALEYSDLGGGRVAVDFADGKPFLELDLSSGRCRALHLCGEDVYEILISVRSRDFVLETWSVEGPTTSYEAVTTLLRSVD